VHQDQGQGSVDFAPFWDPLTSAAAAPETGDNIDMDNDEARDRDYRQWMADMDNKDHDILMAKSPEERAQAYAEVIRNRQRQQRQMANLDKPKGGLTGKVGGLRSLASGPKKSKRS
jgi:hypothetical protein